MVATDSEAIEVMILRKRNERKHQTESLDEIRVQYQNLVEDQNWCCEIRLILLLSLCLTSNLTYTDISTRLQHMK